MTAYPLPFFSRPTGGVTEVPLPGDLNLGSDSASVTAGAAVTVSPLNNDSAEDGAALFVNRIVTPPAQGTLQIINNNTQLRYTSGSTAGTFTATIEIRSATGAIGRSTVSFVVQAANPTDPTPTAGLAVPWGIGQGAPVFATFEQHFGHPPTATAGWSSFNGRNPDGTTYPQITTPEVMGGGSIGSGANWGAWNDVFDGSWNSNVYQSMQRYHGSCLHIWVFPFVPHVWRHQATPGIYQTFLSGGINHQEWKNMWYAIGRRTARLCDTHKVPFNKLIMDVGWEMTHLSYWWRVGSFSNESAYRSCRMIAIDEFRRGANAHRQGGDQIRWMLRVAANKNGGRLENIWTDNDHDPIVGRSFHEHYPVSGVGGRRWDIRSGWNAEVNGTWTGHKLDEVAQFAVDRGLEIGMAEVGHCKLTIGEWEHFSESPVTAVDKIFHWCKRWEQHLSHWCWLHSRNRPMTPDATWNETVQGTNWTVSNRLRDVFNGVRAPNFRDIFTGG